jgi:hypothetical protein
MNPSNQKLAYVAVIAAGILVTSAVLMPLAASNAQQGMTSAGNHNQKPVTYSRRIADTFVEQSSAHNAEGHSSHQALYFVYPLEGKIYNGRVTFTSTGGVDILAYHDITGGNTTGLTIHKVDGRSYAVTTLLKNATSGTVDFVGAGLLAHTASSSPYTVAASVQAIGWANQSHQPGNSTGAMQ